ncbi:MAG: GNAT family N-acetyltransferase [Chloroflexota bacterium]|nr:GNAT family N-acetyltransferase [Chloroflexota bacterium]
MMYVFRQGEPADFAAIIELTELWASEPSTTGHYEYNSVEKLRTRLGSYFWVAEHNTQVIGFIVGVANAAGCQNMHYQVLRQGENYLSLDQLYVHPNHRGRGVGNELVKRLFAAAQANGIHRHLVLSANTDWQRTLGFYQKHGFRPWFFMMFTGPSTEEQSAEVEG